MNDWALMRKNLFRSGLRTALMVVCIFVAFLIFSVLLSFNATMNNVKSAPNRLVVLNKVNFTETLPMAYYERVKRIEGVGAVTHANWFGGYYQDPQKGFFAAFAVDPQTWLEVYKGDILLPDAQVQAFLKDRTGMLASRDVADKFGWKVGQRVPIKSNIFMKADGGRAWDFTVSGIYDGPSGSTQTGSVLFHYDYYNDTVTFGRDRIGWMPMMTTSATVNDGVAKAIDAQFANSGDETSTQDEATFFKSFASQLGNIALVISLVVGAAFFAILLVVGNTMVLAVRERTREIGVMKTIGFSSARILRMVLGESLILSLLGAGLALGVAAMVLPAMAKATGGQFGLLKLDPVVAGLAVAIAIALGVVTGAIPAMAAFRLRIVDALGRR